jgi:hypothetical protein
VGIEQKEIQMKKVAAKAKGVRTFKSTAEWSSFINRQLTRARQNGEIIIETVKVEPFMCDYVLDELNTNNRKFKLSTIELCARMMRAGDWQDRMFNGEIGFGRDGTLADGQNRMAAQVRSQTSHIYDITFGVTESQRPYIDQGVARTPADMARLGGIEGLSRNRMSVLRAFLLAPNMASHKFTLEEYRAGWAKYSDAVIFGSDEYSTSQPGIGTSPIRAAIARAYYYEEDSRMREFCYVMAQGCVSTPEDLAAIRLREKVIGIKTVSGASMRKFSYLLATTAIRKFCNRDVVKALRFNSADIYPINELV